MGEFHKKGGFGRGGGSFSGPKRFGGRPGGFRPGGRGEMFDAVCADCGTKFQLPFRPAEGRSVYCRECFPDHAPERDQDSRDRAPRPFHRDSRPERSFAPRMAPAHDALVAKQLETVNAKLDRLISILEKQEHRESVHEVIASVTGKAPAKAAVKKARKTVKK